MGFFESIGEGVGKTIDVTSIANNLFDKLWPWVQNKVNEETTRLEPWAEQKAGEIADKYTPLIIEKLLAMLPTLAATVAKTAIEEAFKGIPSIPNVVLPPVEALTGQVVQNLASGVQEIPGLSELVNLPALFESWIPGFPHGTTAHGTVHETPGGPHQ
jgi:hypothetical protein